jgi:diguanylate cyclase (GGDEF)-like protein
MELRHYIQMIARGWWIVVLSILIAFAVSLIVSYTSVPIYEVTASFLVTPNVTIATQNNNSSVYYGISVLENRSVIATYADIFSSDKLFNDTVTALHLESVITNTPGNLSSLYTRNVAVMPSANVLKITMDGPDPKIIAALTNTLGERGIAYIRNLTTAYDVNIIDNAGIPTEPVSPQPLRDGGLAAILGLVAGVLLAVVSEQLRIPLDAYRQRQITDRLSGALNRRYFFAKLDDELAGSKSQQTSVAILQLDGLEDFNAQLPEVILNRLLHQIVAILGRQLRGNDIIGKRDDASFMIMLPSTPDFAAVKTLERIKLELSHPINVDSARDQVRLAPRAGIVTAIGPDLANTVLQHAEIALEKARQAENGIALYSDEE